MNLPDRLLAIANLVEGKRLADIGTDHGYLPIYLLKQGKIDFAVCSDVKKGPLANAEKNIRAHGVEDKTRLCLADGLCGILPDEADCCVIAGMGGEMIAHILDRNIPHGIKRFVLQPMRNIDILRRKLHTIGLEITGEKLVREKDKFYIIICAGFGKKCIWSDEEYIVSPFLKKDPLWNEYAENERKKLQRNLAEIEKSEDAEKKKAIEKLITLYN